MNASPASAPTLSTADRYHLLRAASERFQSAPDALDAAQMAEAEQQARKTLEIERLVLSSPEARDTVIPDQRLEASVREIRQRYADEAQFLRDMASNGLDEPSLRQALLRELIFDAVMQRVGARAEAVSAIDARLFFELHRERFTLPERRTACHILITVNDAYAENRRAAALERIQRIATECGGRPESFVQLAQRYSECPSAMQKGSLGQVTRGQLFPTLEEALFALPEGGISGVVESELGFHLLLCERIQAGEAVDFEQAKDKIHTMIASRRRRDCQKRWLAELRQASTSSRESLHA